MEFFRQNQENFATLGISSKQSRINGKSMTICLIYGVGLSLSTIYLISEANSFQEYTSNLYITTALTVGLTYYTIMIVNIEKYVKLIKNVRKYIDKKSKNLTSKVIFEDTNRLVNKFTRIAHFTMANITPVAIIIPKALISYFIHFATSDVGNQAFELPLYYWFPFNWRNPISYLVVTIFQYMTMACQFTFVACSFTFGFGNFFFIISATEDIKNDLKLFNECAKTHQNRLQTLEQISAFIRFHSSLKRCMDDLLDVYQPIYIIVYIWSLVTTCGVMLLVQMEIQGNGSLALIVTTIFFGLYAFGIVLTVCELGQRMTDAFEEIEDVIEEFNWNLFSLELQKMLPIILMTVQQPVELRIFGSTSGLRETFKNVINGGFSYFMVIRQFLK